MTDTTEALGTFACPICGQGAPHHHPEKVVEAYRSDQVRRDGWVSTLVRLPEDFIGKFYLCRGHKIVPPPEEDNDWRFREIHGMLWQRRMAHMMDAEVLQWDQSAQSFLLAQWTGSGTISGRDTRAPVYVTPTHWRELSPFDKPNDAEWMTGRIAGLEAVVKDQRSRLLSMLTNHEYEREGLVRELGEARATPGVMVDAPTHPRDITGQLPHDPEFAAWYRRVYGDREGFGLCRADMREAWQAAKDDAAPGVSESGHQVKSAHPPMTPEPTK